MTKSKRHEWVEAIKTAVLCGVVFGVIAAIIQIETKWQFAIALAVAVASFAWNYRTLAK